MDMQTFNLAKTMLEEIERLKVENDKIHELISSEKSELTLELKREGKHITSIFGKDATDLLKKVIQRNAANIEKTTKQFEEL